MLLVSACGTTTKMPEVSPELAAQEAQKEKEDAVAELMKNQLRLNAVAYRIEVANAQLCGDTVAPRTGIMVLDQEVVPKEFREAFASLYGVADRPTVVAFVPGSVGASSGLQPKDVIIAVNGEPTSTGKRGIEQFETAVKGGTGAPVELSIERESKKIWVTPVKACSYPVTVLTSDTVNSWTDGSTIMVTTGMMRFVDSDDELALIVGHEMGHDTMSHIGKERANMAIGMVAGGVLGALVTGLTGVNMVPTMAQSGAQIAQNIHSQDFEAEADYVGAYYTARAGYSVSNAAEVWRRIGATHPDAIHLAGTDHPSTAKRFIAMEETAREIGRKEEANQPIVPEKKDQPQTAQASEAPPTP